MNDMNRRGFLAAVVAGLALRKQTASIRIVRPDGLTKTVALACDFGEPFHFQQEQLRFYLERFRLANLAYANALDQRFADATWRLILRAHPRRGRT